MAQTLTLPMILPVGTMLYGFCNGYFGRDSYGNKRVEAVGADWLVARGVDGDPGEVEFCYFNHPVSPGLIEMWKTKESL